MITYYSEHMISLHRDRNVIASEALHPMVYRAKRSNPLRLPRR